jgi:alkylation response protein AidB-like acyl-CoA dehydrogenase
MDLDFSEEQTLLRDTVRSLCADLVDGLHVREAERDPHGMSAAVWNALRETGITGVLVADALGGVGLGLVECAIVHEELGRCLAPVPHIPSCVLAARLIALAGSGAQQAGWLPAIACGERIVVTAWQEPGNSADIAAVALAARRDGERIVLDGVKTLVPFANSADALLVIARLDGELAALFVPAHSAGMGLVDLPNHAGQKLMRVDFAQVAVDPANRLDGAPFADAWRRAMHETLIALAAESIGGAQRMLEMATSYAKERVQFGQPIGAFQVIAHYLADAATEIEGARWLVYQAAWAADTGRPFAQLALMAKLQAGAVFRRVTVTGVQIHGGLGFSLDADPQLFYRRAKHQQLMYWDPAHLERRIAAGVFG